MCNVSPREADRQFLGLTALPAKVSWQVPGPVRDVFWRENTKKIEEDVFHVHMHRYTLNTNTHNTWKKCVFAS